MSTPSSAAPTSATPVSFSLRERVKPFLAPYYLAVASVLGAITAVFAIIFVVMILVVTNFNLLGWME